jgi:ABC-type nitrate/sulfonate/bicarbonate transport system permease component
MKKYLKPFEILPANQMTLIYIGWIAIIILFWVVTASIGDKHLFPTPTQVLYGLHGLYNEGLVVHIASSLWLCLRAILISIVISLIISYLSPIPLLQFFAKVMSKLRYLPLTGITFYLAIIIESGRTMQIWVLVVFMSTYLTTSLLGMIKDIPQDEFDHARTLQCNRWEVLWEVLIKGRADYVIEIIRQNLAIVWMMLVTVESIMVATGGLGFLIKNSDKFMNHGRIVALQIIILAVGLAIDFILDRSRKVFFRYSKL